MESNKNTPKPVMHDSPLPLSELMVSCKNKSDLGANAIAAVEQKESPENEVSKWIKDFIRSASQTADLADDGQCTPSGAPPPLDDPFLAAHREEIMLEAIDQFVLEPSNPLGGLINTLFGGESLSGDTMDKIVATDPYLMLDNLRLFPNFKFDTAYIDTMVRVGASDVLADNWRLIEPGCLQHAVDRILEQGLSYMKVFIGELPKTIEISEQFITQLAHLMPSTISDLLASGRFPEARSNVDTLKTLSCVGYSSVAADLISDGLLSRLSLIELADIFNGSIGYSLARRLTAAGRLDSEEAALDLLNYCEVNDLVSLVDQLSAPVQSCVFKFIVAGSHSGLDWVRLVKWFSNLREDDYGFLLDHIDDMRRKTISMLSIWKIFHNTQGDIWYRFEREVRPMITESDQDQIDIWTGNESRRKQHLAENEYFNAGNIQLAAHGYEGELSDGEIIDAFNYIHCVREVGVLRDIASDSTRKNEITCAGHSRQTTAIDIGVRTRDNLIICTEHQALQELLNYLNKQRDKGLSSATVFGDLADNLSYIGEKEYAEAVKGIATYWKWFLDEDSENQLYVDTVVTSEGCHVKSDIYMLDRILGHFSGSEMKKYRGRLFTRGVEPTQDDPSKIKTVLLDDWTISGSQLQSGYSRFVRDHPALASSIEVQLIVASAERVAMGLENLYCAVGDETVIRVPVVTRAYYLAHKADVSKSRAVGARITGSHSSVDYGFANDIVKHRITSDGSPVLTHVIRLYRQNGYNPTNIARLNKLYEIEMDPGPGPDPDSDSDSDKSTLKSRFLKWFKKVAI